MERRLGRRELLISAAALLSAGVALDRFVFSNLTGGDAEAPVDQALVDQIDLDLFLRGNTLRREFLYNQSNIRRIIEVSQEFPRYEVAYPAVLAPGSTVDLPIEQARLSKLKTSSIGIGEGDEYVVIDLALNKGVFFGPDFATDQTPWPAFLAIVDSKNDIDNSLHVTQAYGWLSSQNRRTNPLSKLVVGFYATTHDISGRDFVLFFNRGLFRHQTETAMILPARFNVTFPQPIKEPTT